MKHWIAVWMGLGLAGLAPAQTFQTSGRLVLVDVMVRNEEGVVRGLTKDDFILEDKGKKQDIAIFEITEAGKSGTSPVPWNPIIASNRFNSKGEFQRTATILLYDRVNTNANDQAFVRAQVLRALASLKDTDRVGFYSLGFQLLVVHDYNEDAAPLAKMARLMLEEKPSTDELSASERALYQRLFDATTPMQALSNQAKVNITYPAFRGIAHRLAGVPGRKNLLWVTSTFPITFGNSPERRVNDEKEVAMFEQNLTDNNIVLFPIDPGGAGAALNTPNEVSTEGELLVRNGTPLIRGNIASSLTSNQTMMRLTSATGGKANRNSNDIEPFIREVIQAAEYTYTLGFVPGEKSLDGRKHKLEVKLAKKLPGKPSVTYRKEYIAWGPKSPPELTQRPSFSDLLQETVDAAAVGLMGVANVDPSKENTYIVDVRVSVEDLRLSPVAEKFVGAFDIAVVVDGQESKGARVETVNIDWTADQYRQAVAGGVVITKPFTTELNSGRFHVIVQDRVAGGAGAIRVPFQRGAAQPTPGAQ